MEFWNDILTTALLGTDKRPVTAAALPALVQEAATAITQKAPDPEEQFLQLAALIFNARQCGHKPAQTQLNFPQAAAESFPYCSPRAAQVLKDILEADVAPLLSLWLETCNAAQQIVLPELIPILFKKAANNKDLRQAAAKIGGRRGDWLARLNPEWEFSSATDNEQLWQTGTLDQRRTALKQMRHQDPAKAREWLTQCWPQENANTRTELLKQLDGSLQPEDEPFLLDQLNEKSQKVKEVAVGLLQQLPGSVVVKNYAETAARLVVLKKEKALLGLSTKTTLSIQLPVIPAKEYYLSGIEYLSPNKLLKDEEYVLYQLIQHIPPAFWEQHLALSPAEILKYFTGPNEKYLSAFGKSAAHFKAVNWARAFILQHGEFHASLLQLLPLSERESWTIQNFPTYREPVLQAVVQWPGEWSFDLAKAIIQYTAVQPYRWDLYWYKSNIAHIPMALEPLLKTFAPAEPAFAVMWTKIADQVSHLLRLKEQTLKAFNA